MRLSVFLYLFRDDKINAHQKYLKQMGNMWSKKVNDASTPSPNLIPAPPASPLSFPEGLFSVCLFKAFSLRFINIRMPFRPVLTS